MIRKTLAGTPDRRTIAWFGSVLLFAALLLAAGQARAQVYTDEELEDLVAPIALYPDDLVGIILPASTFPLDIVPAVRFLEAREADPALEPDPAWDDSIVALLNYPEVLEMLDENLDWTWELGEAVLTDQAAVLDAVQRFRARAREAGNLISDDKQTVTSNEGTIEIRPANPEVIYVPVYEPREVVIFQPAPIWRYYPYAYPVYYYPYPAGYHFSFGYFWGVTSYFSIGWHSHYLHVHHHSHYLHPYYGHGYYAYAPYYPRSRVNVTVAVNNYTNVWAPPPRHSARPQTVTVEGRRSAPRTARTATAESQPGGTARMRSQSVSEGSAASAPRAGTSQQRISGSNQQRATSSAERSASAAERTAAGAERTGAERAARPSAQSPGRQSATTETPRMQSARPDRTTSQRPQSSAAQAVPSPGVTASQTRRVPTEPAPRSQSSQSSQSTPRMQSAQPSTRSQSTQSSTRAPSSSTMRAPSAQSSSRSLSAPSSASRAPSQAPSQRSAPAGASSGSSMMGGTRQSGTNSSPRAQGTTRSGVSSSSSSGSRMR